MFTYIEYFLYACICFVPFMLLAYYPLRYFKRFDTKTTILLEILAATLEIIFFVIGFQHVFINYPAVFVLIAVAFNPLAYKLIYDVNLGRILFNLMIIVNYADFTIVFAKLLEYLIFPATAVYSFRWSYSVCILITEVVFLVPVSIFTKYFSDDMIKDNSFDFIWRFAWILPLALATLGFLMFYDPKSFNGDPIVFYGKSAIICGIIVFCQLMMYYYVAKMIRQQQIVHNLEKDVYYSSLQKVQYRKIEEQVKETRVLRHDLRHHIIIMGNYVEQKEYEKLRDYLQEYSQSIESIAQLHYTDNPALNGLLIYYAGLCRNEEIKFDVKILLPKELPLSDSEVTIVLGNLLENAYQACLEIDDETLREIKIYGTTKAKNYIFVVDNIYQNELQKDSTGNYLTTKPEGSGLGIQSVKEILQKHNGYIQIITKGNRFEVMFSVSE